MTRRTTVTIDDVILSAAQMALGTSGVQDTIDGALCEVIRGHRRMRFAEELRSGAAFDFEHAPIDRDVHWRAS